MNKTLFLQSSDSETGDQPQPEARMREALGLRTDGTRVTASPGHRPDRIIDHGGNPRRHRFVQEGEVPVEVMSLPGRGPAAPRHRIDETALAAERLARDQAERAFHDATERLREVQTKLGHAELARDEAIALAAARAEQLEALRQRLSAAEAQLAQQAQQREAPVRKAAPKPAEARPRGRQKAPQPVKWWIRSPPAAE
jgi:hypothetical protein